MKYTDYLKHLLFKLGLLEFEKSSIDVDIQIKLESAAGWALNDADFLLAAYKPAALVPILSTLMSVSRKKNNSAEVVTPLKYYFPPISQTLGKQIFPSNGSANIVELNNQLSKLKNALKTASSGEYLLMYLERHASTLAVSSIYQDIPLFDFIKMTVGIAMCTGNIDAPICLAGASVSGIQSYLYDIISKNASKLLKGRSFYLQLLIDALLEEMINEFNLSPCHVVYASGGGFYVLMPEIAFSKEGKSFEQFSKTISEKIFDKHGFALSIQMERTKPFDKNKTVNDVWDELFRNLSRKKFKRLNDCDALKTAFFSQSVESGGTLTDERDAITNEEFKANEKPVDYFGKKVKEITKQQLDLGKDLREAHHWVFAKNFHGRATVTDPFGNQHYFKEKNGRNLKTFNKPESFDYPTVFYGGNNVPYFKTQKEADLANDKRTNGENESHYEEGDVRPFEYIVKEGNLARLAVLRMDVDGLGKIFSEDIGENNSKKNLCRYAAVSRSLDFFFKGYLNTLRNTEANEAYVNIIYSGGDDLFIVGKWNNIIVLAEEINSDFNMWSCGNLTLSGGIVLVPPKFPIMQAARLAGDAEHKAKNHTFKITSKVDESLCAEKNAITLFETPLNWEFEFPLVKKLYKNVLPMLVSGDLSMNFVTKIMGYAEMCSQSEKLKKIEEELQKQKSLSDAQRKEYVRLKNLNLLRWRWNMAYNLTRFAENPSSAKGEAVDFVKKVMTDAFADSVNGGKKNTGNYHYLELLQVACRWAELEKRTLDENKKLLSHS